MTIDPTTLGITPELAALIAKHSEAQQAYGKSLSAWDAATCEAKDTLAEEMDRDEQSLWAAYRAVADRAPMNISDVLAKLAAVRTDPWAGEDPLEIVVRDLRSLNGEEA